MNAQIQVYTERHDSLYDLSLVAMLIMRSYKMYPSWTLRILDS